MTDQQTLVVLTDDQMDSIHKCCLDTAETKGDWSYPIVYAWRQIMGVDELPEDGVTPWDWAIPGEQWRQIGNWLQEMSDKLWVREPEAKVHVLLVWMNKGPSGTD